MNKSTCIHYNPRYGWDLNNDANLEMRLFAKAQRRQVTILSYGCDLDHHTIKKIARHYLTRKKSDEAEETLEIRYDTYDANSTLHTENQYYFETYFISANTLAAFIEALHRLPGTHIRCEFNVRGHFEVNLNGVEFSTRVLKALDYPSMYKKDLIGRYLLFIDTESPDNEMIRHKIHLLPKELQSLSLPLDSSPLQWELLVKDWITAILRYEV
ncbi:hypothetical protein [Lysinibacillus boronitolerans]|uniref:Uncharacterized protein n=1 Tax=Lysinibacillus boronitolerans JCM 21713 = 10a = NBRC 103108 TaxID=1294264 RepID=A0ABR4XTD9_9BACI|nr:hypothetical protein [Lysinibacillus boronitolerans]KGR80771.1 hypothetical protein CD31_21920 [Lysinibacillus boronitolerans JCM 21713 = 10a = NBRC 103108]